MRTEREIINELLPSGVLAIFDMMPIAERVCKRHGDPSGLFMLLCPSELISGKAEALIEHHMDELAVRFKLGGDTRLGTKAEVLAGLLGAATIAPLKANALTLVEQLFLEVMGKEIGDSPIGREDYPGAIAEALSDARHKTRQDSRVYREG